MLDPKHLLNHDAWNTKEIDELFNSEDHQVSCLVDRARISKRLKAIHYESSYEDDLFVPNILFYYPPLEIMSWAIEKDIQIPYYLLEWYEKRTIPKQQALNNKQEIFVSSELKILNDAAVQFWSTAEPDEKGTHTKQEIVEQWLINNGFSKNKAETGASIIRPEWAAKGKY